MTHINYRPNGGTMLECKSSSRPQAPSARSGAPHWNWLIAFRHWRAVLAALAGVAALACGTGATQPPSGGGATTLAFTVQPSNTTAGVGVAPAVAIHDASGNTVTNASGAVTLALGAKPAGRGAFRATT